jgi:hypothetical protein
VEELRRIETEPLPGLEDFEALLNPPAVGTGMARKVQGYELWVLYRLDEPNVSLRELTARAPVARGRIVSSAPHAEPLSGPATAQAQSGWKSLRSSGSAREGSVMAQG